MHEAPPQAERREQRRYKIRDHLLVTNTSRNGLLVDISLGGVSFCSIASQERSGETIRFGTVIGSEFRLSRVPLEMVSASSRTEANTEANVVLNRYGLKFGSLTEDQKDELAWIIQNLK